MKLRFTLLAFALAGVSSITFAQQPAPKPLTVDAMFNLADVHDAQISPDGQFVAYTVGTTSLKDDKTETRIWMVPAAGGEAIPLTAAGVSSEHPRWSPDGKFLAFLSARKDSKGEEEKAQVYLLNRMGGEAQRLTETIQDVDNFAWAPDGKRLVLVLRDPSPEELEEAGQKAKGDGEDEEASSKKTKAQGPWVIDRLLFKADTVGYLDRRRTHLYVFDIASKAVTQVTSGDFDDDDPAWSPDGKWLAFASKRSEPDPDATYDWNIWVVASDNTDKGAHPKQITTNPGEDREPAWSPDGQSIAYVTQLEPKLFDYATKHIAVISAGGGGQAKVLTLALDRMSINPRFAPDGKSVYFLIDDDGTQNLGQVTLAGGKLARPGAGRYFLESYSISKDGTLAGIISTPDRPYEAFSLGSGEPVRLSHANDSWLSQYTLSPGEYVSFKSKDGTTVHGYLYKPVGYVEGKKYPTILRPHGGPVWAYYAEYQDVAQLLAANGYLVLLPNPRGSSGYGLDYCKAIFADWGDKDFQDDMAMVDYAVDKGLADPDKLGGRLVVWWDFHRLHHWPNEPLQGGDFRRRRGGVRQHVGPRPVRARLHHRIGLPVG
jgi:dipeptidyl aminopeptidase/acylaminoacyl peptidase